MPLAFLRSGRARPSRDLSAESDEEERELGDEVDGDEDEHGVDNLRTFILLHLALALNHTIQSYSVELNLAMPNFRFHRAYTHRTTHLLNISTHPFRASY